MVFKICLSITSKIELIKPDQSSRRFLEKTRSPDLIHWIRGLTASDTLRFSNLEIDNGSFYHVIQGQLLGSMTFQIIISNLADNIWSLLGYQSTDVSSI